MGDRELAYNFPGTYFIHPNWLGSNAVITDYSGHQYSDAVYYTWGQIWQTSDTWRSYFAGFQRYEADLGIYTPVNRSYFPNLQRWPSPDPLAGDITNPQSLNRYAYVMNNPTTLTDPLGLQSGDHESCSDSWYFTSHAECPGSPPWGEPYGLPDWGWSITHGHGGGGGGGGSSPAPTNPIPPGPVTGPVWPEGSNIGNAGFPQPGLPGTWQLPWPIGATLPCDFGICGPVWNPFTIQVGGSINLNLWSFTFTFAGGFAFDFHGHVAAYQTTGRGVTGGGAGSIGTQLSYSNADTVCGLRGPFWNASGTFGAGGAVSADIFQGRGNGPGGIVTGGGITAGAGVGGSGSVTRTNTDVTPIASVPCY